MTDTPAIAILHIGAPKCGSSALQVALSAQPVLHGGNGRSYAYVARRRRSVLQGRAVTMAAQASAYGYVNWPHMAPGEDAAAYWARLQSVLPRGPKCDTVPILSSEGWIEHGREFGAVSGLGQGAPVDAVAYVRPPLDWLNAAYWQWGVWQYGAWHNRNTEAWLGQERYQLGRQIADWAAVPAVRLRVLDARRDAVAGFAAAFGVPLVPAGHVNTAAPPALIGFLLRNRRFRPTPHASGVEFVFNRWCRVPGNPRPWAFLPRFAEAVWPALQDEVSRLMDVLPEAEAEALLADPGWRSLGPYYARLKAGPSPLDDPLDMADLLVAVSAGLHKLACRLHLPVPDLPPMPSPRADAAAWDAAIAPALAALVDMDRQWRRRRALSPQRSMSAR